MTFNYLAIMENRCTLKARVCFAHWRLSYSVSVRFWPRLCKNPRDESNYALVLKF
jgi:hypothetical protein